MSDIRADLPSIKSPNFDQRIREVLMTYLGRQGNPLDRGLTLRDLVENGIVEIRNGYTLRPGAGVIPLSPGAGVESAYEVDLTPPPTPTGFAVNAAISHVFIEHDAPAYTQGHGHLRTRVYGAVYSGGALPTFGDTVELSQFTGTVYAHPSNPATTWHLWIKWESTDGVLSAPAGGTNGLTVTTGQDVALLLAALTGEITESQLYQTLQGRIDLIDGAGAGSVNARIANEAAIRADFDAIESFQRIQGVQSAAEAALNAALAADNERVDRIADVAVAKTELYTDLSAGLSAEAGERTLLAAQLRGGYTGNDMSQVTTGLLYQERVARVAQDDALALQITLLAAGVGEQFDWSDIWYFDTDVESWGGNGAPSAVSGYLRPANAGSGAYVTSPTGLALDAAKYKQVRMRIRKGGSPVFAGFLWWNGAGQSWDVARRVALTEPTYDANDIGLLTVNTEWTGTIDQLRLDLSSAQTGTDYFEVDWFAVGRPSPGASTAQLLDEQEARATAVSAEAASRETLATAILGQADPTGLTVGNLTQGLMYDEKVARSTADSALALDISTLSAGFTNLEGDITALDSRVTTTEQASADAQQTSARASQELISTQRKLDVDADTLLRNLLAGAATRAAATEALAFARTDLSTKIEAGLLAEAQQRTVLAAQVSGNGASITALNTALATLDGSLSQQITTVSATANAKNRTYYQAAEPTTGLVSGDVWFDTDNGNKAYRWSGAAWVETTDTRVAANEAAITEVNTARIGYCTLSGATTQHGTRQTCEAAGGVWNAGLPWATAVKQVSVTDANGGAASMEQAFTAQKTLNDQFKLQYSVKLDNNGYVSGFGLYNEGSGSEFIVSADRFAVTSPATSIPLRANNTAYAVGSVARVSGQDAYTLVCKVPGTSGSAALTGFTIGAVITDGSVEWQVASRVPFAVQAVPTNINGVSVPAGVYIDAAYVLNATIQNAQIADAAVDDAKIFDVGVDKLTAGSLDVGQYIQSTGVADYGGGVEPIWKIDGDGNAKFNNVTVRGTVYATSGQFLGTLLGGSATAYGSGVGFYSGLDSSVYKFRVGTPGGARIQWTGTAVEVYNASNVLTMSSGGVEWSKIVDDGSKPADNATNSNVYRQTTAPSGGSYTTNDLWIDTDSTPTLISQWNGTDWVAVGNYTTNTTQLTDGANLGGTAVWSGVSGDGKPADGATKNVIYRQATAPTGGTYTAGDLWYDTDATVPTLYNWNGSDWAVVSNSVTNTNQIADGAGLGATSTWAGVSGAGKPADNATVGASIGVNLAGSFSSANIGNYFDAAVITNAYIGNAINSTNFNGTIDASGNITADGTTGWAIGKGGKAVFQDVVARGDIEAQSLKANTVMVNTGNIASLAVDTLQIANQAVTIPVGAYTAASTSTNPVQSATITSTGAPILITVSGLFGGGFTNLYSSSAGTVSGSAGWRVKRGVTTVFDSGYIVTWSTYISAGGYGSASATDACSLSFIDTPGAGSITYTVEIYDTGSGAASASLRSITLLEVKK